MAGAGYKLFNTGDVLTAAQVNTYLQEQVVMVFANSTARTTALSGVLAEGMVSFLKDTDSLEIYSGSAWVAYGSGDITGVTAGTGISGGGTSGSVTITNSMATEITAAGDIIVGTGSGTFDNLPIGTTGQVLTADTTVSPYKVKWASAASGGGFTLLETLTLSGTTTTSSSMSSSYKHICIVLKNVRLSATDTVFMRMNSDTGANYYYTQQRTTTSVAVNTGNQVSYIECFDVGNTASIFNQGQGTFWIWRYTDTDIVRMDASINGNVGGNLRNMNVQALYDNSAAISTVTFYSTSSFSSGTAYIYGVS